MLNAGLRVRQGGVATLALVMAAAMLGCSSKQDKAIELAKKQAVSTGQPQQVSSVDKDGNTVTTVVQPPAQGQKDSSVVTTTTSPAPGAAKPSPQGPTVSAWQDPAPVIVPAGTTLAIRLDQSISVKGNRAGDQFTGEVVDPLGANDGGLLVPKGARVKGLVDVSHKRGHFKGASSLELRLTSIELNGADHPIETGDLAQRKKGKGKRSAGFIGGGAGVGMLIGGLAAGPAGVLWGGLAGGGAGTAAAGLTGNRDLVIPAETVVRFKLAQDLVVRAGK